MDKSGATGPGRVMSARLIALYDGITPPHADDLDKPLYASQPIPGYDSYLIGKDREGHACLLVAAVDPSGKLQSPIRLENLDVQFELRCHVRRNRDTESIGIFTVIRCRSLDGETIRYFLTVCETIVSLIGDKPSLRAVAAAVHRLAAIFQKVERPPVRPINGLFGELYLIWRSGSPAKAVAAWRTDDAARFDFSDGDIRLDVKATGGRLRAHVFSYEQCNPPPGSIAIVASLFVERALDGLSLRFLIEDIGGRIAGNPDLLLKLHDVVAGTLGQNLSEALSVAFDAKLADSSLRFFKLDDVPALRGSLPNGVSDVHFRSDLSVLPSLSVQALVDRDAMFWDLLPRGDAT
jgi:hypothetical protein